ncbi:unnamed protein product, partial [Meganyctiphanes norvegica]
MTDSSTICEDIKTKRTRLTKQILLCTGASLGHAGIGSIFAFPSPMLSDLEANNSTIYGKHLELSDHQEDMISSVMNLAVLLGGFWGSYDMGRWGRKHSLHVFSVIMIIGWIGVALIPNFIGILLARILSGIALGGISVAANTYVVEIADVSIRGVIGTIPCVMAIFGQLLCMLFGYWLHYYTLALVLCVIPIAFIIFIIVALPPSPTYLIVKGKEQEALKVLQKLRNKNEDLHAEVKSCQELNEGSKGHAWKSILQVEVLKPLTVLTILFFISAFSGWLVINANASRIFENAGIKGQDSENLASIIINVAMLVFTIISCFLVDKIGRKFSLILSLSMMAVSLIAMSVYVWTIKDKHSTSQHAWIPVACMAATLCGTSLGINPIPFILINEYFPTNLRGLGEF